MYALSMDIQALSRQDWKGLDPLEQPRSGRLLETVGFVLGDSFETILRSISEDYLRAAWQRLSLIIEQHRVVADDLSWGWMHSGETSLPGEPAALGIITPTDFTGWLSCNLARLWDYQNYEPIQRLDNELKVGVPSLRCTTTWRSMKWNIAPQDFALALKLIEVGCTDEVSEWHPQFVLQNIGEPTELWRQIAREIQANNQQQLDTLLEEAKRSYTPLGLRILLRGYSTYLQSGPHEGEIVLPQLP